MSYEYAPPSAIAMTQSQVSNSSCNLSNTCTVSPGSHKSSCRTSPYTIRHKYLQEGITLFLLSSHRNISIKIYSHWKFIILNQQKIYIHKTKFLFFK